MNKRTAITMHDNTNLCAHIQDNNGPLWIIAVHGIGESSKRYAWLKELFHKDFNILQYDLRGHGQSEGSTGHGSFETFQKDLENIVLYLKHHHKMKKYILFGHSMGALICATWLQNGISKELYPHAVFLNAPPVGFTGILGKIVQNIPLSTLTKINAIPLSIKIGGLVDTNYLSHSPNVKEQYHQDPDNQTKLHSKLLFNMVISSRQTFSRPLHPQCPAFVTVGSGDKIICVDSLIKYFKSVEKKFHLQVFEGAWHEIHNEVKKYQLPYFNFLQKSFLNLLHGA